MFVRYFAREIFMVGDGGKVGGGLFLVGPLFFVGESIKVVTEY